MKAQMPPFFCASATVWSASVVLPEDSGPKISTTRPRGSPPTPSAMSSPSEPDEMVSTSIERSLLPSRMIEPLPKLRSICESAASRPSTCPWTILRRDAGQHVTCSRFLMTDRVSKCQPDREPGLSPPHHPGIVHVLFSFAICSFRGVGAGGRGHYQGVGTVLIPSQGS